jgi:hypothetical protein
VRAVPPDGLRVDRQLHPAGHPPQRHGHDAAAFKAEPRALCRSCHSPLIEQHPILVHQMEGTPRILIHGRTELPQGHPVIDQHPDIRFEQAQLRRNPFQPRPFLTEANPEYDSALAAEGVTCVTCHVREGTILTANRTGRADLYPA